MTQFNPHGVGTMRGNSQALLSMSCEVKIPALAKQFAQADNVDMSIFQQVRIVEVHAKCLG